MNDHLPDDHLEKALSFTRREKLWIAAVAAALAAAIVAWVIL
jgi:hypothetical protein